MMSFGFPLALFAGAGLAAAALVLHLFAPRPPDRVPLPTARFLRPEARLLVRPRRVPSDVPVLALRVALALLLGALFAQPRWVPDRENGTTRVVLLDRGAGMAGTWDAALARALAEAAGEPGGVVIPFDTAAGEPLDREGGTDGSSVGADESSYLIALRALRSVALRESSTSRVEAVLVSRPRWSAWDPQLAALRRVAWPGPIRVIDPAPGQSFGETSPSNEPAAAAPRLAILPEGTEGRPAARIALEVLGYRVADDTTAADAVLRFFGSTAPGLRDALDAAARGDTVVVFGAAAPPIAPDGEAAGAPDPSLLWDEGGWPADPDGPRSPGLLRVGAGALRIDTEVTRAAGAAREGPGRRLAIAWEDGAPAGAAMPAGAGCLVRFGGPLDTGSGDGAYPTLLRALADGCRDDRIDRAVLPLDSAARAVLGGEGSETVAVAALGDAGRRLEPWVLLALAIVALVEVMVVEAMGRGRGARS